MILPRLLSFLLLAGGVALLAQPAAAQAIAGNLIVQGQVFSNQDSTTHIAGVELVFSGKANDNTLLSFRYVSTPAGSYRVVVPAGRTYQVAINKDGRNIETQEFAVPTPATDSARITKNFYLSYITAPLVSATPPGAMPSLEWPLPPPSTRWTFPEGFLKGAHTFGEADQRLLKLLGPAGYSTFAYYVIPAIPNGYACVTQLEQIKETGAPQAPRWNTTTIPTGFLQNLRSIILPVKGRFRVLVFVVTPQALTFSKTVSELPRAKALSMFNNGASALDGSFGKLACPPGCRVTVLVYEYLQADISRPSALVRPSRVQADTQLTNSRVRLPH